MARRFAALAFGGALLAFSAGPAQAGPRPDLDEVGPPSEQGGAWVATLVAPTPVRRYPGGKRFWLARTWTSFNHQGQRLLVLDRRTTQDGKNWLRVRLPIRPNKASGWIPSGRALLNRTRYWVTVDLSRRLVRVRRNGRVVRRARAVVGKPATPTPRGLFAVYETVPQPNPKAFLGTWALHITAHSQVLYNFGGGDGRVAIHGRGGASFADPLGSAASHGCVRVNNGFIGWLQRQASAGTPVRIRR